jgi:hypothetical protein
MSYKNIDDEELFGFKYLIYFNIFLNIADVFNLGRTIVKRVQKKQKYKNTLGKGGNKKLLKIVNKNLPTWTGLDLFDFGMRIVMTVMLIQFHNSKNYNPDGSSTMEKLSELDKQTYTLTTLPWLGRDGVLQDKFDDLLDSISRIVINQNKEGFLRLQSYFMLFFMLMRVIIYMNCHPRIAVLYGTVLAMLDDLFHFTIIASIIYLVFAYSAYWMIGADNSAFETLPASMWSQFQMVIGEFPFNENEATYFEYFYMIMYAMIVFVLLINSFLLAVVVGAYENVKDAIENCLVEQNVVFDVFQSFYYALYLRPRHQWPDREEVAIALAGYDVDNDGRADSSDARIKVQTDDFMKLKNMASHPPELLFKSREKAVEWMNHFVKATPVLEYNFDPPVNPLLMHQQTQLKLTRLAWLANVNTNDPGADLSAFDEHHETDEEKAQKAAETVADAMKELSELIPSLGHQFFTHTTASPKAVVGNIIESEEKRNGSGPALGGQMVSSEYLALSEKLSAQMTALTDSLEMRRATSAGIPSSIQNVPEMNGVGPVATAAVPEDVGDLKRLLTRMDEKMERMLANQEFVRNIAQNAGARPTFSPRDRIEGPGMQGGHGHRQIGGPPMAVHDEGVPDSSRFLAECLHPEIEDDIQFSDRHPNGGILKETYAPR